jgi:hypothetical protein
MVRVRGHFRAGSWVAEHVRSDRSRSVAFSPPPLRLTWPRDEVRFRKASSCHTCGKPVFFIRHNGGCVWLNECEPPWPKHGCYYESPQMARVRESLMRPLQPTFRSLLGVIVEIVATRPGFGGRIVVECSDGSVVDEEFDTFSPMTALPGMLVVVTRCADGWVHLHTPTETSQVGQAAGSTQERLNRASTLTVGESRFSATHYPRRGAGG